VGRRRQKTATKPLPWTARLPLAAAYVVALVCVAGGVLVLVFGAVEPQAGEQPVKGSVTRLGVVLIVLGVLAAALTGYMRWAKTRR